MATLNGILSGYWEQGWEGRFEYTLDADPGQVDVPKTRPVLLQHGQFLRIFEPEGGVRWEGKIRFRRRRRFWFREDHSMNNQIYHDLTQRGLEYGVWIAWFFANPRLRAELQAERFEFLF